MNEKAQLIEYLSFKVKAWRADYEEYCSVYNANRNIFFFYREQYYQSKSKVRLEVCRICGEKVPLKFMKDHSFLCRTRSELEMKLSEINSKISKFCEDIFIEKKNLNLAIAMEQ